jgi:hypothetical protein
MQVNVRYSEIVLKGTLLITVKRAVDSDAKYIMDTNIVT